jgi:glycosyltransferase involved in cell wall biosynthesis
MVGDNACETKFHVWIHPSPRGSLNPYLELLADNLKAHPAVYRADFIDILRPFCPELFSRNPHKKLVHLQWIPTMPRSRQVRLFKNKFRGTKRWLRLYANVIIILAVIFLAKILRRTNVVWTIHNASIVETHPMLMRFLRGLHFFLSDGYVIQAETARRDIPRRYAGKPVAFCHRPNFIGYYGPPASSRSTLALRRELGIAADAVVFLVLGLLRTHKNIEDIVEAFQEMSVADSTNIVLLIAGEAYDLATEDNIRSQIVGSSDIIIWPQRIPDEKMAVFLGSADYIVIGHERGYTSAVMFLAMSYSRPALIREWGAALHYIRNGENGFFFDWNTLPAVFEKAVRLRKEEKAYRRMCDAALAAMRPLTWEKYTEALVSFYRELL